MDKSYYFVLEPGGTDQGPYRLPDIQRRIAIGLVSRDASLCKVGETDWMPVKHDRYAALLEPPAAPPPPMPRRVTGTAPLPVFTATEPAPAPDLEVDHTAPVDFISPIDVDSVEVRIDVVAAADIEPNPVPVAAAQVVEAPQVVAPAQVVAVPPVIEAPPVIAAAPVGAAQAAPVVAAPPAAPVKRFAALRKSAAPVATAPVPQPAPVAQPPVPQPAPAAHVDAVPALTPHAFPAPAAPAAQGLALRAPEALPAATVATAAAPRKMSRKLVWGLAGGGVATLAAGSLALFTVASSKDVTVKDAMVHVTTASGTGAGFFIQGPDEYAYVATANHIVDRGERILVERDVGTDKHAFVEAYPQTEVVASDPDADLAIIRIKNVKASRFVSLPLASAPRKDARILAYGYPGSSLAKHAGLVSKDGKILSLASFPAYDQRYGRILRENAVDGLLISADIEPGFSGGPTTTDDGEVVGVNVTKDRAHVGQNGAVSVVALRKLLETVKPASKKAEPTTADVTALLDKIQSEYLLLPLEERSKVRETQFVNAGDLPALRRLVGEVRREERNTDTSSFAKYRLSGQAALGIYFARLPGKLLETYRSPSTTTPLVACELSTQHLTSFLTDLSAADTKVGGIRDEQRRRSAFQTCDELAVRPLAWDLVASTLQWDGQEKKYTVTKLERMDDDEQIYRASVRISGASNLIDLWLAVDQHDLRLKLFDTTERLYAINSPRSVQPSALQGTWSITRPRVTDAINKEAEIESGETLDISIDGDRKVSIRHVVSEKYFGAGNRARAFKCSHKSTIETGLLQSFTGNLENGVIVALPDKPAEIVGVDAAYCEPSHKADRIVAVKLMGDQLTLYRTDGNAYPETIQLAKK